MLIATDGACKRNGTPECCSAGVAWVQTEAGDMYFKSKYETQSTSQRGEINGLILGLEEALRVAQPSEDIIIVTDSEYLYNTVELGWSFKWYRNHWVGATGPVKNPDMWQRVNELLDLLNVHEERVFMQWTKGHLFSYTPGNVKRAMREDPTGIELFSRLMAVANRGSERERIINDFIYNLNQHDKATPPREECLTRCIANVMADCLASYVVATMENVAL